jgi:hypothetical protein
MGDGSISQVVVTTTKSADFLPSILLILITNLLLIRAGIEPFNWQGIYDRARGTSVRPSASGTKHRLLGASPPPAPSVASLPQPAPSALPPGIPQGLRPSAYGLTPEVTDENNNGNPPPLLLDAKPATAWPVQSDAPAARALLC